MRELTELVEIKQRAERELLAKGNVRGVGVGYKTVGGRVTDELAIVVLVTRKIRPLEDIHPKDRVPPEIEGARTDVVEVGLVRVPPPGEVGRRGRMRPAPGGCSIGHVRATAGTLGCLVRREKERFILSNNHVLAATNLGAKGDYILQPGPADGGRVPEDGIAELSDYVRIDFGGENRMDAALARPFSPELVTAEILEVGEPTGIAEPELGAEVAKSGRTTGLTRGTVDVVAATVDVLYGLERVRFVDQCVVAVPGFSAGGDSGSVVLLPESKRAVGLLFAGSEVSTIFTPLGTVLEELRVEL